MIFCCGFIAFFESMFYIFIMNFRWLQKQLSVLTVSEKLISSGSLLMILGAFLPWYNDLDRFNIGDVFLGVTGPLTLIGVSLIGFALFSLSLVFLKDRTKIFDLIPHQKVNFHFFEGIFSFYLLILASSIYFNAKFGINLSQKQSGVGMFLCFIAASLLTIGGYLDKKTGFAHAKKSQEISHRIPQQGVRFHEPIEQTKTAPIISHVEQEMRKPADNLRKREVPAQAPHSVAEHKTPQPYRMDL